MMLVSLYKLWFAFEVGPRSSTAPPLPHTSPRFFIGGRWRSRQGSSIIGVVDELAQLRTVMTWYFPSKVVKNVR